MPLWMSVLILEAEQVQACSVLEWDSASFFFGVGWGGNDIHKHRGLTDIQYPCKKNTRGMYASPILERLRQEDASLGSLASHSNRIRAGAWWRRTSEINFRTLCTHM